jgi:hypothetical protein
MLSAHPGLRPVDLVSSLVVSGEEIIVFSNLFAIERVNIICVLCRLIGVSYYSLDMVYYQFAPL